MTGRTFSMLSIAGLIHIVTSTRHYTVGNFTFDSGCKVDADCRAAGDEAAYCKANGACRCDAPFYGELCQMLPCPDDTCSGHGTCNHTSGTCICDEPYVGDDCSVIQCPGENGKCSNHGSCDKTTGKCTCTAPWVGGACNELNCPKDCSDHGDCDHGSGVCACDSGWTGDACDTVAPTPENCTICAAFNKSYCKCNNDPPQCQGTSIRCDACCAPKPPPALKKACDIGASPLYPPAEVAYDGGCGASQRPGDATLLPNGGAGMTPAYDSSTWPYYDQQFDYVKGSTSGGVASSENFKVFMGVKPDPAAGSTIFASNADDGWYATWLAKQDKYRDCSRQCDADAWNLATDGATTACETVFNVPQYQNVNSKNESSTLADWEYGAVTDPGVWKVDFQDGLHGELGMLTSLNGQGAAVPDPTTGHWRDNVQIVWDDTAPLEAVEAGKTGKAAGKYVARMDTWVELRTNDTWVIESTGGLVTNKQFMSGTFEVTAKIPQSSGQVFALWLFNGAKSWSAHTPYTDPSTGSPTCFAPSAGCAFFNSSNCESSSPDRCPFDNTVSSKKCAKLGGTYVDKDTAPFTCLGGDLQSRSLDPLWIDRLHTPGSMLPQLCKEFPNSEIDWEFPSNAPDTIKGPPFTPHACEHEASGGKPCKHVHKYNTSNINNYRFTDGSGEGTYTNLWVEKQNGDFIDGEWHTYRMEVHSGTSECVPRVDYFMDGEYVGSNNAFVPRVAGRFWIIFMDRSDWSSGSGGWNGILDTEFLEGKTGHQIYSSVHVSEVKITPYFETKDTYGPQPYDQPNMGAGSIADCGKKNPPNSGTDSSFVPYYTSGDHAVGEIKWTKKEAERQ